MRKETNNAAPWLWVPCSCLGKFFIVLAKTNAFNCKNSWFGSQLDSKWWIFYGTIKLNSCKPLGIKNLLCPLCSGSYHQLPHRHHFLRAMFPLPLQMQRKHLKASKQQNHNLLQLIPLLIKVQLKEWNFEEHLVSNSLGSDGRFEVDSTFSRGIFHVAGLSLLTAFFFFFLGSGGQP